MCKKQTSVSHTSTESEIISLDTGLRLDGLPALELWGLIVLVLGNTTQNHDRTVKPVVCRDTSHAQVQSRGMFNVLNNVDLVPSNVQFSHQEALLYVQKFWMLLPNLPGCAGQPHDAVSAFTQVKMEDAPTLLTLPEFDHLDFVVH